MKVGNGIIINGWEGNAYKSIDDGLTWTNLGHISDFDLFATEYLGSHRVLLADNAGNIFRSTNLGYKWSKMTNFKDAADDFISLGWGAVYYSTYTGERNIYISLNYGKDWHNIGKVPSGIKGDWLDHGICINTKDSVIAIAGTSIGNIIRNAIPRKWLYDVINRYNGKKTGIPENKIKPLLPSILGSVVDFNQLIDPEDILLNK